MEGRTKLEQLRKVLGGAPCTLLLLDEHGKILICISPPAGASAAQVEGHHLPELLRGSEWRPAAVALADAQSPGIGHLVDVQLELGGAGVCWYTSVVMPLRDTGSKVAMAVALVDINARCAELERLRRAEQLLLTSQKVAHFGTWEWDPTEVNATWSPELFRIYGLDPGGHVPSYQDYLTRVHPEDRERVRTATERAFVERQRYSHDERVYRPDGSVRYLHTWAEPVENEHGKLSLLFGVCQDITDQMVAEQERDRLLEGERAARAAAEQANSRATALAEVGRLLASESVESKDVQHRALVLCLGLGDWATLTVDLGRRRLSTTVAHREAPREAWARAVLHRNPVDPDAAFGPAQVLRSGQALLVQDLSSPPQGDPLVEAAPLAGQPITSYLSVPATAHGRTYGALTIAKVSGPPLDRADQAVAEELAFRFAASLESAHLLHEAEEAVAVRDEFLTVASHELRTPLATMKLQAEAVLRNMRAGGRPTPRHLEKVAQSVLRQVNRLALLTDHLLDVAALSGGFALATEPGDLGSMVREAVDLLKEEVQRSGSQVQLRLSPGVVGRWDRGRVEQVVSNLVGNALKYGGGAPVEVAVEPSGRGGRITVTDRGIGITEEDVERVFGRFERAVSPRHYGGLGLGLYISREIVEAHGGSIVVRSVPGEGTTFVVELPSDPPVVALSGEADLH